MTNQNKLNGWRERFNLEFTADDEHENGDRYTDYFLEEYHDDVIAFIKKERQILIEWFEGEVEKMAVSNKGEIPLHQILGSHLTEVGAYNNALSDVLEKLQAVKE